MSMLEFRLLGSLSIRAKAAQPLDLPRKQKAMLAVIALGGQQGLTREKLIDLLWQDHSDVQARANLRQALAATRRVLGVHSEILRVSGDTVLIDQDNIEVDVQHFEILAASQSSEDRKKAAALYHGDLLDGVQLKENGLAAWLMPLREHLRSKAIALLSECLERSDKTADTISTATRLLALEPVHEAAHRALMRSYADQGRESAALKQFKACRDILDRELGIAPDSTTVAVYDDIKRKRRSKPVHAESEREDAVGSVPTLDGKPSIVILPFVNHSEDPGQDYLADGMTDDIITALSQFRWLFVIARNSSFSFKGQATSVGRVAAELNARYVLDGSVRRSGNRIRVVVRLIDAIGDNHLWAHSYDNELDDVFDLQDDIAHRVSAHLKPELERAEWQRLRRLRTKDLNVWGLYLKGLWHSYKHTRQDNRDALILLQQAIEADPTFSPAYATASYVKMYDVSDGYADRPKDTLQVAFELAEKAVELDDHDAFAHYILGRICALRLDYEQSISELEFAIGLNPSLADAYHGLGFTLAYSGKPEESIPHLETAFKLSPHDANVWAFFGIRAVAYIALRRYDDAIRCGREAIRKRYAKYWAYSHLVSALGHGGRVEEAKKTVAELRDRKPDFSLRFAREHLFYYKHQRDLEHYLKGLQLAGLTE